MAKSLKLIEVSTEKMETYNGIATNGIATAKLNSFIASKRTFGSNRQPPL